MLSAAAEESSTAMGAHHQAVVMADTVSFALLTADTAVVWPREIIPWKLAGVDDDNIHFRWQRICRSNEKSFHCVKNLEDNIQIIFINNFVAFIIVTSV